MAKIILFLTTIAFLLAPSAVWAAQGQPPRPSDKAYENADENARFKRGEDGKLAKEREKSKVNKQKSKGTETEIEVDESTDDAKAVEDQDAGAEQGGQHKSKPEKPKKNK